MQAKYDFSNTKRASQTPHLNRLREQNQLLDEDVSRWLVVQDTKRHISEIMRQVMALKNVDKMSLA